jgi:hypothetical protein
MVGGFPPGKKRKIITSAEIPINGNRSGNAITAKMQRHHQSQLITRKNMAKVISKFCDIIFSGGILSKNA